MPMEPTDQRTTTNHEIFYRLQDNNGAQDKNRTQDNNRTLDKLQGTCLSGYLQEQKIFANLSFKLSHSPALGLS